MKQILQSLRTGAIEIAKMPCPSVNQGHVLIRSTCTLLSAGTERMLLEFGNAGWVQKARQQPDRVRMVLDKVRTDGLLPTLDAVRSKLDQPLGLGYCNVGIIEAVGTDVKGFAAGDRVASNGSHAEVVSVPQNLCACIPHGVSDEDASFTVIGSIALEGVRLAEPTLGECFVVMGLGLIGLMTVQLLRANGCRVLGIDPDPAKTRIAVLFGAEAVDLSQGEDPTVAAEIFSRGRGVDGVLLTLSSKSSGPVSQAASMCRKRGRVILVGVTGLELSRDDFYKKELSFQVSCSYGPGRYDSAYEDLGRDYPVGFVRWTEQRNFEAILDLIHSGGLNVKPLITHRFPLAEAPKAYDLLVEHKEPYLGILLEYGSDNIDTARTITLRNSFGPLPDQVRLGIIGAGNYAGRVLIPAFKLAGVFLHTLANNGGVNGAHYARKYGFIYVTTDVAALVQSSEVNALVVATRHDSHARYVCSSLLGGKHVFVEKPLALTLEELVAIEEAYVTAGAADGHRPLLMVGFNRRFSVLTAKMKSLLNSSHSPKNVVITVNAGEIPPDHWLHDPAVGGGRIIGECCHFIDLARYLIDAPIVDYSVQTIVRAPGAALQDDKANITLTFKDGSVAAIQYLSNGHKSFPKERVEVFCAGRILQLDNFRRLKGYGWPGFRKMNLWRQDKGQNACAKAFVDAVMKGGPAPISFEELMEVSRVTVALGEAARE